MDLQKRLSAVVKLLGVNFTLNQRSMTTQEVFSEVGLMPAIARRADQLSSLCLGYGIGASFEEAEQSLLGRKVIFDEATPTSLRLMCILDVVCELVRGSPTGTTVPLDELMYD